MTHLDIDRVIAASGGEMTAEEKVHLAGCVSCRGEIASWRQRINDLREIEASPVDAGEIHNLLALFRHLGPSPAGRSWIASLVRSSEPAAAAVRGSAASTLQAYRAGPWEIVVQIRPTALPDRFDLQGQVVDNEDRAPGESEVVLLSAGGYVDRAATDEFGEFRFRGVPAGPYRALWMMADGRIEVESLTVGDGDDAAGH